MSPSARGVSLWYVLMANASTKRFVAASHYSRRFPPLSTLSSRSSSSSSRTTSCFVTHGSCPPRAELSSYAKTSCSSSLFKVCHHPAQLPHRCPSFWRPCTSVRRSVSGWAMKPLLAAARLGDGVAQDEPFSATHSSANDVAGETANALRGVGECGDMKVTLLSGFLGAGKTTLMRNVLRQAREERLSLAVIVNDMVRTGLNLAARTRTLPSYHSIETLANLCA